MCEQGDTVVLNLWIPGRLDHTGKGRMKPCDIDRCLANLVEALNTGGILTEACCCGHGKRPGNIILGNGQVIEIHETEEAWRAAKLDDEEYKQALCAQADCLGMESLTEDEQAIVEGRCE